VSQKKCHRDECESKAVRKARKMKLSILFSIISIISICFIQAVGFFYGLINIFMLVPFVILYIYIKSQVSFSAPSLIVVIAILLICFFPIMETYGPHGGAKIFWLKNIFGTRSHLVLYREMLPWNIYNDQAPIALMFHLLLLSIGFAAAEAAGHYLRILRNS
jgi:hypothetical protein